MVKYFWHYSISGDTAAHRARGVGPATDYETPWGTKIHAPFPGRIERFETTEGGRGIRVVGDKYTAVMQHLESRDVPGGARVAWRQEIATSGNTGTATDGPHVHCYIIINSTGKRISFYEWLRDYVNKSSSAAPAKRTVTLNDWAWYTSAANAQAMRNPRGKKWTGENSLKGTYEILGIESNGAVKLRAKDGSTVWAHSSAVK